MLKNVLKFCTIGLLLLCLAVVALFGFQFADYDLPGLFSPHSIMMNRDFGGGTSLFLAFEESDTTKITTADYEKAVGILKERFVGLGYTDVETSLEDKQIRVDVSTKVYLDELVGEGAAKGSWSLKGYGATTDACTAALVESVEVSKDGAGITIHFTESGAATFYSNIASTSSSSVLYLYVDGNETAYIAQPTAGKINDTLNVYSYYGDTSLNQFYASLMNNEELPAAMTIQSTKELAPKVGGGALVALIAVEALLFVVASALLVIKGKKVGIFAVLALLSNVAIFAIMLLNRSYILNIATLALINVCMFASVIGFLKAVAPFGKINTKERAMTLKDLAPLNKFVGKFCLVHLILFFVALIALFTFQQATVIYITRIILTFICANVASFFIFFYFGTHTLATAND